MLQQVSIQLKMIINVPREILRQDSRYARSTIEPID